MAEFILPGVKTVESEFQTTPPPASIKLTGACGPNGLGAAERWADANPSHPNTVEVNAQLQQVVNSPNGVSTLAELRQTAHNQGYSTVSPNAGESVEAFAERAIKQQIGACVAFYDNGQALVDFLSGGHEDATNLHGHFNALFGYTDEGVSPKAGRTVPAGFWVADGDNLLQNPIVNGARVHRGLNGDLDYYPVNIMQQAQFAGAFAVVSRKGSAVGVPTGWTDDPAKGVLTAPNGVVVVKGFRDFILANGWNPINWPLAPEYFRDPVEPGNPALGAGTRQEYRLGSLGWTANRNVYVIWVGQDLTAVLAENIALKAENADLRQQLQDAHKADVPGALADLRDALTKLGG